MSGLIQVWRVDNSPYSPTRHQTLRFVLLQSLSLSLLYVCFVSKWMIWHGQAHILIVGTSEGTGWLWRLPSGDCKTLPGHGCKNTCATILAGGRVPLLFLTHPLHFHFCYREESCLWLRGR